MLNSSATQWRHRFNLDINLEKGSLILGAYYLEPRVTGRNADRCQGGSGQ